MLDAVIDKSKIRIIFVQDRFFLGGIEILEIKLAKELSRNGYDVIVAARESQVLDENKLFSTRFVHMGYPDFISRATSFAAEGVEKLIFVSLHPTAAMASEIAGRRINDKFRKSIPVHHLHWVSHSRAFFFSQNRLVRCLFKSFFPMLPEKSTYFMNDAALAAHQSFWGRSLENYPVLRIVGRDACAKYAQRKALKGDAKELQATELRIVSVGRLVPFKSYNVNAPKVVKRLRDSGIDASWDIWGYGPDEAAVLLNAQQHNVKEHVRLCGALPHAIFDETVSSYDVFVGMGTSVLEAANTGTPVCVAVENQGDACYGHLHQAPTDSVGDRVQGFPEQKLHKFLHAFAMLSPEERSIIGEADASAARQRESRLEEFSAAILSAEPLKNLERGESAFLSFVKAYLVAKHWKSGRAKG